ncbi:hypothetical protein WJX79_007533 [Trebouxia sp. C0005]
MPGSVNSGQIHSQLVTVRIQHDTGTAFTQKVWAVTTNTASPGGTDGVAAALYSGPAVAMTEQYTLPGIAGRVHATMPLPFGATALPVHVNGAFWVQSDRRKLWSGEGDRGKGAENDKILVESVAPAWAALIQSICGLCHSMAVKSPEDIYRLWPLPTNTFPKELHPVAAATISCLIKDNGRVLWSPAADQPDGSKAGQWPLLMHASRLLRADSAEL